MIALKREKAALDSALLARDARALELRFEVDSGARDLERTRRRISELESALLSLGDRGVGGGALSQAKGPAGKRETELERVVDSLKRVVEKLKSENEKLKRAGASDERSAIAEKKAAAEKRRADALEAEVATLQAKTRSMEDAGQKLVQRQQQVALLRRQMKLKEDELSALTATKQEAEAANLDLRRKISLLGERAAEAEARLAEIAERPAASLVEGASAVSRLAEQERIISDLRTELQSARLRIDRLSERGTSRELAGDGDLVLKLQEENRRLREELSAFDLDFFEEIENLKFAHAEAVRKLRILEQSSGTAKRALA